MLKTDRILLIISILGISCFIFMAGMIAGHYHLFKSRFLTEALEGGRAWYERIKEMRTEIVGGHSDEALFAQSEVTWDQSRAYNGYTLICLRTSTNVYLLDMQGSIVHRWVLPFNKAWPSPTHIQPLAQAHIFIERSEVFPNGDLLAV